jgi:hypothetical protein
MGAWISYSAPFGTRYILQSSVWDWIYIHRYISYRFSTWRWRHPTEFLIGLDISNRVSCGAGYTVLYSVRRGAGYVPQSFILVDISLKTPHEAEYIL